MLPNEVFALACRAYYDEQGFVVDATNGQFAHCPLPRGMGDKGYYLLWEHHQQQGLLQSRDVGRRCFWVGDAKRWLQQCDYWPDNYFELWEIYEEFGVTDEWRKAGVIAGNSKESRAKRSKTYKDILSTFTDAERKSRVQAMNERRRKAVKITFLSGETDTYGSAQEAAIALQVSVQRISKWARGECNPTGKWAGIEITYLT
jgi:hypothetical protein